MPLKHIGQTTQTVLKHLVGIEGVKVPSEPSNKRMILESNFKIQIIRFYLSLARSVAYGESEVKLFACKEIINRW
jgi:hypothetical protein